MTRISRAWGALAPEQRIAAIAAIALLLTMFLPWYDLQSLDPNTRGINSHSISAFGDVSFVEAAVFLVAAGVIALLFARAERRDFHMPGSDGAVVMVAGGWATLLIFYRVFSRPAGHGYPVGIQWGFFLAFVAAGALTYAGWRMRANAAPEPPLVRPRSRRRPPEEVEDVTAVAPAPARPERAIPVPARGDQLPRPATPVAAGEHASQSTTKSTPPTSAPPSSPPSAPSPPATNPTVPRNPARRRPRFPPAPSDQLSFEDTPPERS